VYISLSNYQQDQQEVCDLSRQSPGSHTRNGENFASQIAPLATLFQFERTGTASPVLSMTQIRQVDLLEVRLLLLKKVMGQLKLSLA
jgi:hypothetical protein